MSLVEQLVYATHRRLLAPLATAALRVLGVNIPPSVEIGRGLQLPHGAVGLVVHERTVIGDEVKIYQGVTLGRSDTYLPANKTAAGGYIRVGDRALIGANATVLFRSGEILTIGESAVVGAGSVVLQNVPAGEIWAGNPARFVAINKECLPERTP